MSTAGTTLHAAAPPRNLFSKPYRVLFMGCTKTSTFLVCVQQGLSMPRKEQSGCTSGSGLFSFLLESQHMVSGVVNSPRQYKLGWEATLGGRLMCVCVCVCVYLMCVCVWQRGGRCMP